MGALDLPFDASRNGLDLRGRNHDKGLAALISRTTHPRLRRRRRVRIRADYGGSRREPSGSPGSTAGPPTCAVRHPPLKR